MLPTIKKDFCSSNLLSLYTMGFHFFVSLALKIIVKLEPQDSTRDEILLIGGGVSSCGNLIVVCIHTNIKWYNTGCN